MDVLRSNRLHRLFLAVLLFSLPVQGLVAATLMGVAPEALVAQVHVPDHADHPDHSGHMGQANRTEPADSHHDGHATEACNAACAAACSAGMISAAAPMPPAPAGAAPDTHLDSPRLRPLVDDNLRPPRLLVS